MAARLTTETEPGDLIGLIAETSQISRSCSLTLMLAFYRANLYPGNIGKQRLL